MSQTKSGIARSNITQKKRRTWNAREKLAIITYQEKTQASIRSTSGLFGIEPKQFRDWRLKKNKLMLVRPHIRRLNTGSRPKYPELEIELNNWIRALRAGLRVVTRNMIQIKAKTLARTQRFSSLYPDISTFLWGHKWLNGFMNRYRLSNRRRTTIAQRLPQDYDEKQREFLSLVLFRRMKHEYPLKLIGNMDETPLSFDLPSNFTVDETGARTISIRTCGYEKSNFTVVLCCMADGTKLPPLIIFKLKNVPRLDFPVGVKIRANQQGWMNTDEMLFWIENVWNHRAPLSVDPHSLLVLDSFRGHLVDSVKQRFEEKRTDLAVIPGGLTSRLQPLDIAINKPFKDKVKFLLCSKF